MGTWTEFKLDVSLIRLLSILTSAVIYSSILFDGAYLLSSRYYVRSVNNGKPSIYRDSKCQQTVRFVPTVRANKRNPHRSEDEIVFEWGEGWMMKDCSFSNRRIDSSLFSNLSFIYIASYVGRMEYWSICPCYVGVIAFTLKWGDTDMFI